MVLIYTFGFKISSEVKPQSKEKIFNLLILIHLPNCTLYILNKYVSLSEEKFSDLLKKNKKVYVKNLKNKFINFLNNIDCIQSGP